MRLAQITPLLLEMNLANGEEIRQTLLHSITNYTQERRGQIEAPVLDLLVKRLMRAISNDEAGLFIDRQPLTALPRQAPKWMKDALKRKEAIYQVALKPIFKEKLPHILDWLMVDPRATNAVRTVPEGDILNGLNGAADKYFAAQSAKVQLDKNASIANEPGRQVVMTFREPAQGGPLIATKESDLAPNDTGPVVAFWARLTSAEALDREGALMGHCVGSYAEEVADDRTVIYSLRDAKNQPHATLEVSPPAHAGEKATLHQCKGKQNKAPVAKYMPFVRDFLNAFRFSVGRGADDLDRLGIYHNPETGKFGTVADIAAKVMAFPGGAWIGRYPATTYYYFSAKGEVQLEFGIRDAVQAPFYYGDDDLLPRDMLTNLCAFLNKQALPPHPGGLRDWEKRGVFYAADTKLWGSFKEVATEIYHFSDGSGLFQYQQMSYGGESEAKVLYVDRGTPVVTLSLGKDSTFKGADVHASIKDTLTAQQLSNLKEAFNANQVRCFHNTFEQFGLFNNLDSGRWGTPKEIGSKDYEHEGFSGYSLDRMTGSRYHASRQNTTLITPDGDDLDVVLQLVTPDPKRPRVGATIVNADSPSVAHATDLLVDFFNKTEPDYADSAKQRRETLRTYGVIYVPARRSFMSAAQSKKVVAETKSGKITAVQSYFYVCDKDGHVLASADVPMNYRIVKDKTRFFGSGETMTLALKIIAEACAATAVTTQGFTDKSVAERGYIETEQGLVDASHILKKIVLPGKVPVKITIEDSKHILYEANSIKLTADADGLVKDLSFEEADAPRLPALFKAIDARGKIDNLLKWHLYVNYKTGKVTPITSKDKFLSQFIRGRVDLGHGFQWKSHSTGTPGLSAAGAIRHESQDRYDDAVRFYQDEKHDPDTPMIKMRKVDAKAGYTRKDAYKAAVEFMHDYHELIEPMAESRTRTVSFLKSAVSDHRLDDAE